MLLQEITIDACTYCQLRCPLCTTGTALLSMDAPMKLNPKIDIDPSIVHLTGREFLESTYKIGFLKLEDLIPLIKENPQIRRVFLSSRGESLLNPQFVEIVRHLASKNIESFVDSNLNYLTDKMAEGLVRNGMTSITVSIDGACEATYKKYRFGGSFKKVIENVKKINKWKEELQSEFPYLTWQFIVFKHNEHEIEKAKSLANELKMRFIIKPPWRPLYGEESDVYERVKKLHPKLAILGDWLPYEPINPLWVACYELWVKPRINWDGRVFGCCLNNGSYGNWGNVFDEGLSKIFKRAEAGRKLLTGNLLKPPKWIPCLKCDVYKSFKKNGIWYDQIPHWPYKKRYDENFNWERK